MTRELFGSWLAVVLYAGFIFSFSSLPSGCIPEQVSIYDNVLHFLEYLPFGLLVLQALRKSFPGGRFKALTVAFFAVGIYALSDEAHQLFVPGRQFSFLDILFDIAGASAGFLLITFRSPTLRGGT